MAIGLGQNRTAHKQIMGSEFNPTALFSFIHKPQTGSRCLTLTAQLMQAACASTNCNRNVFNYQAAHNSLADYAVLIVNFGLTKSSKSK